ncbi:MAG: sulfotransferase [Proteobacteria bacterium]|nr:sulfotransferase [Pseudomonadota bacterium]MBU1710325.1 sulfotransferase [Pseudomonadota bacterium]
MPLPNFFIIGAPRSGTTYMHNCLKQHPQIFFPIIKEPSFFSYDKNNPKIVELYSKLDAAYGHKLIRSMDEYANLFIDVKDKSSIGESSTNYLYFPNTAQNIYKHVPTAKIIVSLRNPVDALYSICTWAYMYKFIYTPFFNLSIKEQLNTINEFDRFYFNPYFYYKYLSEYLSVFDRSRIKIVIFEEWIKEPEKCIPEIFNFLELDTKSKVEYNVEEFKSDIIRSLFIKKIIRRFFLEISNIINPFSAKFAYSLKNRIKATFHTKPPPISPESRNELLKLYHDDIMKLQDLLDRDLSLWLK